MLALFSICLVLIFYTEAYRIEDGDFARGSESLEDKIQELRERLYKAKADLIIERLENEIAQETLISELARQREEDNQDISDSELQKELTELSKLRLRLQMDNEHGKGVNEDAELIERIRPRHLRLPAKRYLDEVVSPSDIDQEALQHYIDKFHKTPRKEAKVGIFDIRDKFNLLIRRVRTQAVRVEVQQPNQLATTATQKTTSGLLGKNTFKQ